MKKSICLAATILLTGSLLAAQNQSSGNDNPAATDCVVGAFIAGSVAVVLDILGMGGLATSTVLPAVVGGCVSDTLHGAVSRAKEQQPSPSQSVTSNPQSDANSSAAPTQPGSAYNQYATRGTVQPSAPTQYYAHNVPRPPIGYSQSQPPAHQESQQEIFQKGFNAPDPATKVYYFSEAIRLDPSDASAFYDRGLARQNQGDLSGAWQDYEEAVRLRPNNKSCYDHGLTSLGSAFYNRAAARQARGDVTGAQQDFASACRLQASLCRQYAYRPYYSR
jgi:tetratricopeptide (TPR) repeat protein